MVLDSAAVSRQHARILQLGGEFYLEDLHSRNGTYVNGQRIHQQRLLQEQDRIALCDNMFVFLANPTAEQPPARR